MKNCRSVCICRNQQSSFFESLDVFFSLWSCQFFYPMWQLNSLQFPHKDSSANVTEWDKVVLILRICAFAFSATSYAAKKKLAPALVYNLNLTICNWNYNFEKWFSDLRISRSLATCGTLTNIHVSSFTLHDIII